MKKQLLLLLLVFYISLTHAQTWVNKEWIKRYSNLDSLFNSPTAVDVNGNVYVAGYSLTQNNCYDFTTIKYNPNGVQLWVANYNGPANGCDRAIGLVLDGNGNAYVTGVSQGVSNGNNYVTIKYDPNGNQLWLAN